MRSLRAHAVLVASGLVLGLALAPAACTRPETFTSTIEIQQTQLFGTADAPTVMDVHMVFPECPGTQRKVVRGDKAFAPCAKKYKVGDKVPVAIQLSYQCGEAASLAARVTKTRSDRGAGRRAGAGTIVCCEA